MSSDSENLYDLQIDKEQLDEIEEYASTFLTPREIAILMGLHVSSFLQLLDHEYHPVSIRYKMGKVKAKYKLRKKTIDLAEMGSPQAQIMAEKYLSDLENETDHEY